MTAILILIVAGLLAWLYGRFVIRLSDEQLMGLNVLVLVPWVVIAIGTITALLVWA